MAEAFCSLLLGMQYASNLPNQDRLVKFLSRLKEAEFDGGDPIPGLTTTDLCKTGLPPNWCYIQYSRGPLQIADDDEFRVDKVRTLAHSKKNFSEDRWGYGKVEINFWLLGNNGSATEAAEALFYIHLYRVRSVDYLYAGIPWRSRVIIEAPGLATFEPFGLAEYGTGFAITWRATLFVPILKQEVEGFTVQDICTELFDATLSVDLHPLPNRYPSEIDTSKSLFLNTSIHTEFNSVTDETELTEQEGRCSQ